MTTKKTEARMKPNTTTTPAPGKSTPESRAAAKAARSAANKAVWAASQAERMDALKAARATMSPEELAVRKAQKAARRDMTPEAQRAALVATTTQWVRAARPAAKGTKARAADEGGG
jgi:hypothetical protein